MIMFTGSTSTGRKVAEAAARRLIPASLELGGKDPMIVLLRRRPRARRELRRPTTRCRTPARRASRSSASTSRSRCTTSSSRRSPRKCARCASGPRRGPGSVEVGAITFPPQLETIEDARRRRRRRRARACSPAATRGDGRGTLLRADGARRRRPHDEVHDRGDVRADAADHEGRRRRGGACAWPTTRPTASARSVFARDTARGEADRAAPGGRRGRTSTTR